jgi:hypothetical protein
MSNPVKQYWRMMALLVATLQHTARTGYPPLLSKGKALSVDDMRFDNRRGREKRLTANQVEMYSPSLDFRVGVPASAGSSA